MEEIDSMDMENRDYTEVCMVLGEVFCARVEKDGQISIKVYNENGNPYEAYFKIRHGMGLECIRSTYPMEYMEALLNLMDRQLPFTVDWARG